MRVYIFLVVVVGCWGIQWKTINDFKDTFKAYWIASANTISSIQNILDDSRSDSDLFFNITYSANPLAKKITKMKSFNDRCFFRFIDGVSLKYMFENQIHQFQIPLRNRLAEIRQILNKVNSSIDIYERYAKNIFRSCYSLDGYCTEETNGLLRSIIYSLSCLIHPNCQVVNFHINHSIRKRTICHPHHFSCEYGKCITRNSFCDDECDCADCSDEPDFCVKDCTGFRCSETFRCISNRKKCNGIDDCGDGTDEEGCRHTGTIRASYRHLNCSIDAGDFLCRNKKCIGQEQVCNGNNDCGDWSDEGEHCKGGLCSQECQKKGGVCFVGPKGSECLSECPSGTYETSEGCNVTPEAPLSTLVQLIEDTPRLRTRYEARLKYLKNSTISAITQSFEEVINCKKSGFSLLHRFVNAPINDSGRIESKTTSTPMQTTTTIDSPNRSIENIIKKKGRNAFSAFQNFDVSSNKENDGDIEKEIVPTTSSPIPTNTNSNTTKRTTTKRLKVLLPTSTNFSIISTTTTTRPTEEESDGSEEKKVPTVTKTAATLTTITTPLSSLTSNHPNEENSEKNGIAGITSNISLENTSTSNHPNEKDFGESGEISPITPANTVPKFTSYSIISTTTTTRPTEEESDGSEEKKVPTVTKPAATLTTITTPLSSSTSNHPNEKDFGESGEISPITPANTVPKFTSYSIISTTTTTRPTEEESDGSEEKKVPTVTKPAATLTTITTPLSSSTSNHPNEKDFGESGEIAPITPATTVPRFTSYSIISTTTITRPTATNTNRPVPFWLMKSSEEESDESEETKVPTFTKTAATLTTITTPLPSLTSNHPNEEDSEKNGIAGITSNISLENTLPTTYETTTTQGTTIKRKTTNKMHRRRGHRHHHMRRHRGSNMHFEAFIHQNFIELRS